MINGDCSVNRAKNPPVRTQRRALRTNIHRTIARGRPPRGGKGWMYGSFFIAVPNVTNASCGGYFPIHIKGNPMLECEEGRKREREERVGLE